MSDPAASAPTDNVGLGDVLSTLKSIQQTQASLVTAVESLSRTTPQAATGATTDARSAGPNDLNQSLDSSAVADLQASQHHVANSEGPELQAPAVPSSPEQRSGFTSRIVLTTYPKQSGIDPLPLKWGHPDPLIRGPVVVSRLSSTLRRRNAVGGKHTVVAMIVHPFADSNGGSYSIYYALAVASKQLDLEHRPDFTNTEPASRIGPFPQWGDEKKIVAMDPWGHLAPWLFKDTIENENVDIRPTIAITKAHMKVVWYLPGVAERFGIDEGTLRRSLFEHTGGSYPELITRNDIKVFMPPIGGLTVYCFGDPAKMSDDSVRLALRIHDECNGSDVFGSDICTCRPYLIFGIEEAVKEAQNGGSGVVIYFRKEGRALGEVTKTTCKRPNELTIITVVYNARKRGEDRASDYFRRTENIAGVKDMRFQALMPDVLHWLGIKKIDRMLSMSNMKHDAIVSQGIPIHERVELPEDLIPADSRVEIDAKITAGYFTAGKRMTEEELSAVQGRLWEE
ncbi:GTP cyclohydrolase II [Verticillium dahliae]|nr:GTP cyclohydrolase II [Verticillium dahliae]